MNDIEILRNQKYQLVLYLFADLLNQISSKNDSHMLIVYDLFEFIIDFNEYVDERNKLIRKKLILTFDTIIAEIDWIKLNENQRVVVEIIYFVVDEINDEYFEKSVDVNHFFFDDFEDTKKNFVQNIVLSKLRFENHIVLIVIFFDIVVILLNEN